MKAWHKALKRVGIENFRWHDLRLGKLAHSRKYTVARIPIPVTLIGRLAVDSQFQGKGLGSILLANACQKISQASAVLAVAGIIVDAKDHDAIAFYAHFGFVSLQEQAEKILLPTSAFQAK